MFKEKKHQGFTLVEFLVALSIIVILSVVAIPSFMQIIRDRRLSITAEELHSVLQNARSEAVKRNANVYVSFATGNSWCYGVNPTSACDCTIAGNCTLGTYQAAAAQQLTLSTSGLVGNNIYFEGSHGAANASGSVTFTQYNGSRLITISIGRMGGLQMCSTGISGYTAC